MSEHEGTQVRYVNEADVGQVVNHVDRSGAKTRPTPENLDAEKDKAKSKCSRRKAVVTRHLNVADSLLASRGSRKKLRELADKLEIALQELERASENYCSFLEGEQLQNDLQLIENVNERVNECIQRIELQLSERENGPPSDTGSDAYFSASMVSSHVRSDASTRVSETEKRARVAELEVEQAKREALRRAEEERRIAEENLERLERERQLKEQRHIRELEYKAEQLRLQAQQEEEDPENLENRLRDFEASDFKAEDRVKFRGSMTRQEITSSQMPLTPQMPPLPSMKTSTQNQDAFPASVKSRREGEAVERLDVSWIRQLHDSPREQRPATDSYRRAFEKSILWKFGTAAVLG